ncbi:MAG: NAD(P)H-hydrate dehydratase [Betaproteobacteria bacterium]|nr:NAD(P)H-hydrate dehydratase [Betaproteobacteria bacterium]
MVSRITHNTPIYRTAEIREIEAAAGTLPLMERAGLAAAELARGVAPESGRPILVLAGPGNNGGDAFVIARHLKQWWFNVTVVFTGDESRLSGDTTGALAAWRQAGGLTVDHIPAGKDWGLVVDGLFGIGLQREATGRYADLIAAINAMRAPKLAVDIPSGLESDTGRVMGCAVRADCTITFIALKPGLLTCDGPDHCGELHIGTLGIDAPAIKPAQGVIIGEAVLGQALRPRRRNTHKGDFGSLAVIGGAYGMVGAALLAGRAALKLGTGRVYLGLIAREASLVDMTQPELMLRSADEALKLGHLTALAAGPGLGQSPDAAFYLQWAMESSLPLVIDADGLNLVGATASLKHTLQQRPAATVLTPHPAEAARLLGCATREIQHDRVAAALRLAQELNSHVVLKGAGSICAAPDGTWGINTSGNPGMASAGMGDVLAGLIAALLAQGVEPKTALHAGVHLHGAAADALVAQGAGPAGLTAGETIDAARRIVNDARRTM